MLSGALKREFCRQEGAKEREFLAEALGRVRE